METHLLEFDYSYGYNCSKYNLLALDETTLLFISENLLHFFNVNSREFTFRRSTFGTGIGFVAKNPCTTLSHFAVAENGEAPTIFIYNWPDLEVVKLIENAAKECFASLCYRKFHYFSFSPNGEILVSCSGMPEHVVTIHNWSLSTVLFKSFTNMPIHGLSFSSYSNKHFTSYGTEYVTFWEIVDKFTGIKLEKKEGKFDKTDTTQIICTYHMPDDTFISGCEWSNILVWKDAFIKVEIERMQNRKCHDAPITQFAYKDDELWSISMDGRIKIWHYKSLENKKLPEDQCVLAVEPIFEFYLADIKFMGIHKVTADSTDTSYFVQDGNGGIWNADLNTAMNPKPPIQLYKCHGGAVADMTACPWNHYVASLGSDGRFHLYQYIKKELVFSHQYPAKGTCMIWLPLHVHKLGDQVIMGFDDGNLRVAALMFDEENITAATTQVIKSHSGSIITIALCNNRFVSGGEDSTIFIYSLNTIEQYVHLIPIGFIPLTICPSYLKWHSYQESTVVIGSSNGYYSEIPISEEAQPQSQDSYFLHEKPSNSTLICNNSPLINKILWFTFFDTDIVWFSMDGTDSGRVYEKNVNHTCDMIYDAGHVEINNCVINEHRTYIFFTMNDGNILITKINPDNRRDFSISWQLALHNFNRFSSQTCFSHNEKYLFICWSDGNIISYKININEEPTKLISPRSILRQFPKEVEDTDGYRKLSLEELKMKIKHDLKSTITNRKRQTLRHRLQSLRAQFEDLLNRNGALPLTQIIPKEEFEIHPLITQFFKDEHQANLACVNRDHAVQIEKSQIKLGKIRNRFTDPLDCFPITVKAISSRGWVKTIAQRKLAKEFHDALILVEEKIKTENETAEWKEMVMSFSDVLAIENPLESQKRAREKKDVFLTLLAQEKNFGPKINQLLERYKTRRIHFQKRKHEWEDFTAAKPLRINTVEDQINLRHAIETVGDYKLKSDKNYKVPKSLYTSVAKKYHSLLQVSLKKYKIVHQYNDKVYRLRERRMKVLDYLHHLLSILGGVQEELEEKHRKPVPVIPDTTIDDFPERNLDVKVLPEDSTDVQITESIRSKILLKDTLVDDGDESEWEAEASDHRKACKLFEQNLLLRKIYKIIQQFDDALNELSMESCTTMRDVNLLDLHLITLNRELIISKQFEQSERLIYEKIYANIEAMENLHNSSKRKLQFISQHVIAAKLLYKEKKRIKFHFLSSIAGHEHASYLKKLFKSNETAADAEMSENSSDESECNKETALAGVEPIVPCESQIYKATLNMRTEKFRINEQLKYLKDAIDALNVDIKCNDTMKTELKAEIGNLEHEMEQVQKQKQDRLNDVMCTLVLKLNQLQHLKLSTSEIGETLVFSQPILTNLYKRVGQLHQDTVQQEIKHKECLSHIWKMKTDFHRMKENIKTLEQNMDAAIKKKVGKVIPVDLIEEVRLRDKLFKFNVTNANVHITYQQELTALSEKVKLKQIELRNVIKENTDRQNVLAEINRDKTNLMQTIRKQSAKKKHLENVVVIAEQCKEDIEKLSHIIKKQNQDIEILQNEIKRLSLKSLPIVDRKVSSELLNLTLDIDKPSSEIYQWKSCDPKELREIVDLPDRRHLKTQVQIPSVISDDAEELVIALIMEMCESLQVFANSSKRSVQQLVKQILPNIMQETDVDSIIKDLTDFLSTDFTYEQQTVIKDTAHQIYTFLHSESNVEDLSESARELLIKVISETITSAKDVNTLIEEILLKLVHCLPIRFLIRQSTVDMILAEIRCHLLDNDESLLEAILNISTESTDDLQELLDSLIETVYKSKS